MTYTVKLVNASNNWVIESKTADTLQEALDRKTKWFREFHRDNGDFSDGLDYSARVEKIHLPVAVLIEIA